MVKPVRRRQYYRTLGIWILLLGATVASSRATGFVPAAFSDWRNMVQFVAGMFPPRWDLLPDVLLAMGRTVAIAFLGTLIAFVLAFPISFVTARNTGTRWLGLVLRAVLAVTRSVPEVIWALVFLVSFGFGDVAGIMALAVHNFGILGKLIGETLESAPLGPQEAVAASGAPYSTVVWLGILPWALPTILSHAFFRFECNIRTAAILGVVGAGGIGKMLEVHKAMFQYDAMLMDTLGILALVLLADAFGALLRKAVT